jgi:hypothetical protein
MTGTALSDRRWLPFALGGYAAAVALLPFPESLVAAAIPLALAFVWLLFLLPHLWLIVFLGSAILLPPLPISLGDSGPHVSMALAAIGGLIGLSQLGRWRMPSGGPAIAMAALLGVMFISLLAAALYSRLTIAASSLARTLLFGVSVYVYWYLTAGPGRNCVRVSFAWTRIIFAVAAASAAIACLDFYFQLPPINGFAPQFVWLDSGVFRRAQGMFYEASALGNFCAFFLVMIAIALVQKREDSPLPRLWLIGGACLFTTALVFSYSRASIVNAAVALLALAILRRGAAFPIRAAMLLGLTLAGAALALYELRPEFLDLYSRRLSGSLTSFFASPEGVLSGRVSNWERLLEFAAQNPQHVLFGIGYKTLPYTTSWGNPSLPTMRISAR